MKKSQALIYSIFLGGFSAIIFSLNSCKKTDQLVQKLDEQSSIEKKFFGEHLPENPLVNSILSRMQHHNRSGHFVGSIVSKVGYPYWDKAILHILPPDSKNNSENPDQIIVIPFVRENEQYVNSELVVKITGADTVLKWRNDWQYNNYPHGPFSNTNT